MRASLLDRKATPNPRTSGNSIVSPDTASSIVPAGISGSRAGPETRVAATSASRIHAVGFPVMFSVPGVSNTTGVRFATLMRLLCRQNGGTFVGLSRL